MRVLKFGGTSLADAERFSRAADIIVSNQGQSDVSAVLSAPAKVTNILVSVVDNTVKHGEAELPLKSRKAFLPTCFMGLLNVNPTLTLSLYLTN